jgi:gluconolactonase
MAHRWTRRDFVAGVGAIAPAIALAQTPPARPAIATPPSVITNPPRLWDSAAPPEIYPDPDIVIVDRRFNQYLVGLSAIHRVKTGFQWAEGPAWSAEGNYVVFSDIKANVQHRYIWETGEVTPFRNPSFNSNGNSFDFQGRQISCQGYFRRVVRWELDGSLKVIADAYDGKLLNSPNDLVSHPDGSIWFTDPPYGTNLSEGHPDLAGGPGNPDGIFDPAVGDIGVGLIGRMKREAPVATYRWDPSGRLDRVVPFEQAPTPNGICFSPDYKILYLINAGKIFAFDVHDGKLANMRVFTECAVDGVHCGPDGMRADRAGNIWVSSNAPLGYSGVIIWSPAGELLGRIRLPEACANLCFAGPKRDWLFMCASQSVYMLRVNIQGASPG